MYKKYEIENTSSRGFSKHKTYADKLINRPSAVVSTLSILAAAILLNLVGSNTANAGNPNVPTDMPPSPLLNGTTSFSQHMLRFEEFGLHKVPDPGTTAAKTFPAPSTCQGRPDPVAVDAFLDAPLWPDPTVESNDAMGNPWAIQINNCLPGVIPSGGVAEGRPGGIPFAHQRADDFPPQVYFNTAQGGARNNLGRLDNQQRHGYTKGEFAPGGLYYNVVGGIPGFDGTTNGIPIKMHPNLPTQNPLNLWTFGDGTMPPKLLQARYGEPVMMRHYNALPIDVAANAGFGEHTITTHEHNGHNPGESDGFAGAFFYPGEYYDYRWPMAVAGTDSINRDASDPRASTPCKPGEVMNIYDPITDAPIAKTCDPVTHTIKIPGDWHELMSSHWFHDHMIDRTSQNVYKGNAAEMNYYSGIDPGVEGFRCHYSDPANNINLCFPSGTALNWGNRDYDVQLMLADKAWDAAGQLQFSPLNADGFLGDRMTVNWLYDPYFDVRARKYRFRLLNGAVSRFFKIAIVREFDNATDGDMAGLPGSNKSYSRIPFHLIANDGNIMEHTVKFPNPQSNDLPIQSIAERFDIIIDFSQYPVGTKLYMVNTLAHDDGRGPKGVIPLADILNGTFLPVLDKAPPCADSCMSDDTVVGKFLEFRVQPYTGTDLSMNPADYEVGKKTMIPLVKISDAELAAATHRTFKFGRGGGISSDNQPIPWTIATDGGAALNADVGVVSAAPETMGGGWEIWHITTGGGWAHPVHVHFEESQYLLRSDGPGTERLPPVWEQGARKDMYRISNLGQGANGLTDSSLEIDMAVRFREFAGTFVEHCHNTVHEDKAMLLRWDNEHPGQTVRIPTPLPTWDGVDYVATAELATIKTGDTAAKAAWDNPLISPSAPKQLSADLNWDGVVNLADYSLFRSQYGKTGPFWGADMNESWQVNLSDYSLFRSQYGKSVGFPLTPNNAQP